MAVGARVDATLLAERAHAQLSLYASMEVNSVNFLHETALQFVVAQSPLRYEKHISHVVAITL